MQEHKDDTDFLKCQLILKGLSILVAHNMLETEVHAGFKLR